MLPLSLLRSAVPLVTLSHGVNETKPKASAAAADFNWYSISPSENISWTPCFTGQQCARLSLPIDYSTPGSPPVAIALIMQPATDKANYQGTILVNPGGPGGSGTQFVQFEGTLLSQLFGPTFDVLGFDPRGTGASTPLAQCFASPEESDAWSLTDVKVLRPYDGSVQFAQAKDDLLGELCVRAIEGNGKEEVGPNVTAEDWGIGRFMDTATVATDMLHIVEKLGQKTLQYYGISYGTALGQYFAALYPDRIGRMVVDGVVEGQSWQRGDDVVNSVLDADRVMGAFFEDCVAAGVDGCAIWESTARAVAERVDRILFGLKQSPIALPDSASGPAVLALDDALSLIFEALYSPLDGFPLLSLGFRAIETRDTFLLSQVSLFDPSTGLPPWLQRNQAIAAVACSDFPALNRSIAADIDTVRRGTAVSHWAGGFDFSRERITCGAWGIRAKKRYTGPVSSANLNVATLAISNTIDPVTPLRGAKAVVPRFKGMRLLLQNTVGHSAIGSLSSCVAQAIRVYFTTGTLPAEGTVCQPDVVPLVGTPPAS